MKQILNKLFDQQLLTHPEALEAMLRIGQGEANAAEMAAFMSVYRMRPISVPELAGFREALLSLSRDPELGTRDTVDIVGTGGDGKDTLNISTLACFVVAGAGYKVTKHGNIGVSSVCGSSDVLQQLGVEFGVGNDVLQRQLERAGICFLHAPAFHPAMRHAGPVRRELGVRTFFNILGPLVNPARPKFQVAGTFSLELLRLYHYLLQQTDTRYAVVHALDGYDELSLTAAAKLATPEGERVVSAADLGLTLNQPEELAGGRTAAESAAIFVDVLEGRATRAQRDVVTANAALAIGCLEPAFSFADSLAAARESLDSGRARQALRELVAAI
ncbi:anthranilate phosphoribosyltransferase [Hymenobacter sp. BT18]|uniref:Anthranilate phosphoribosyltransferase n=1 Tax=Hymenobacter yonginensis TaxID=748197 RepID=A0ABY7PRT7_9BACT|nr:MULTISPECIES: anthranilate phosphoribosyltransferase [Hymenobacter]QIX62979.1 anthranilate phosphoribosyltransferase [Hymenobacter sp. BT18]WBO85581.1 anthranilate phosphoribosyltransferase [Hymenobacter yonginensis]